MKGPRTTRCRGAPLSLFATIADGLLLAVTVPPDVELDLSPDLGENHGQGEGTSLFRVLLIHALAEELLKVFWNLFQFDGSGRGSGLSAVSADPEEDAVVVNENHPGFRIFLVPAGV